MLRSVFFTALIAFSASAAAEDLSYTYFQVGYGQVELDDSLLNIDGNGFSVNGSFAVHENWHVFGEYQLAEMDFDVDLGILEAGFGYNTALSENVDIAARLGYVRIEADAPGVPSESDDGYSLEVLARGKVSEAVELNGGLGYVDSSDADGETRVKAGFIYNFTDSFSAGVDGTWWEDVSIYRLSARFSF